jgi:hypothetical protein
MRVQFEVRRLPSYLASIPPALSALLASVSPSALDHSIRFHSTRQEFLKSNHRRLDKETMYRLLSAHGRVDFLLMYAALLEDYEKVKSRAAWPPHIPAVPPSARCMQDDCYHCMRRAFARHGAIASGTLLDAMLWLQIVSFRVSRGEYLEALTIIEQQYADEFDTELYLR